MTFNYLKSHSCACWEFLQVTDAASALSDPTAQLFHNTVAPSRGHLRNSPPTPPSSGEIKSPLENHRMCVNTIRDSNSKRGCWKCDTWCTVTIGLVVIISLCLHIDVVISCLSCVRCFWVLCSHLFPSETPFRTLTLNWCSIFAAWSGGAEKV